MREKTQAGEVVDPDDVYILDERALTAIADSGKPDTVKLF